MILSISSIHAMIWLVVGSGWVVEPKSNPLDRQLATSISSAPTKEGSTTWEHIEQPPATVMLHQRLQVPLLGFVCHLPCFSQQSPLAPGPPHLSYTYARHLLSELQAM